MKKIAFIASLLICGFITLDAQNEMQALRYSQYNPFGTARYAAQGGAIGALGGDLSSIVVNPAGLGFYRSSEYSFSPTFYWANTSSDFMGSVVDDSQLKFAVGSLGMVSAKTSDRKSGIVGVAYSVGYNTLVNFNNRTTVRGINNNSSLLDDFTWHANADPDNLSPYYEQLSFDAFLTPYDSDVGAYWHDMQVDGYGQQLNRTSEQSGYIGEYSLAGAINFSNLLYFGASLGIHAVRFYEEIYHTESDYNDHVLDFDSFEFREYNSTKGWGYTMRAGIIIRPIQLLRIGASFQMPTYYRLTDEKYTDLSSYWDSSSGLEDTQESSPNGVYDYQLRSPFRANANISVILSKLATFSGGYEYVDYGSARLDAYDYKFFDENDAIRHEMKAAHNIKFGTEFRLNSLYLRGGTQYLMSPFSDNLNNADQWIFGGGLGFRTQGAFFDISYTHSSRTDVYGMYAYRPSSNEVSINQVNNNNLMVTLGFKF
ncbi:MAG: hypothetical protein DRI70_04145 [Bacteroidetes bacterium]|nr:MAG: hypothetical protein DRI70_04145 [Bacteroidota bacterium]